MSRHRGVRNMDYSEDYDGYDDVYGHSMDDEYCISPGTVHQYMYNRENTQDPNKLEDFVIQHQGENCSNIMPSVSDMDKARLESCVSKIKELLGEQCQIAEAELEKAVLSHDYDVDRTVDNILNNIKSTAMVQQDQKVSCDNDLKPTIKIISAGSGKTPNVTKGFEISSGQKLNTPRSQSPYSGRSSPADESRLIRMRENRLDPETQYRKERGGAKEHLYMVVVGHVDAGKSTLMGHLLCELGQVNQKTMHKYEQESRKLGKQSFMYAWVLDETGEERNRGITMDVGRHEFETKSKLITLLDAPGHKDFIPNMIAGAGQADVALLVVDATRGEFETGFDSGGQTREHTLLVRSLGVTQLVVAINKLDTVSWCQERFEEIVEKLKGFLRQVGFRENDIAFVPCSGLTGENLIGSPTESQLLKWYHGPCLLDVMDQFRLPERPLSKPFRLAINDIFKGTGVGFCVSGRVETGCLYVNDRVLVCPSKEIVIIKSIIGSDETNQSVAFAGDQATVTITGIDMQKVSIGNVLCDPQSPVQVSSKFHARIVVFNLSVPLTFGYSVILHHQSLVEPVIVSKLLLELNKSTGEVVKRHPRFLTSNTSAMVEITISRPVALELYSDCKELGRIMLRSNGETIAAGLITKIF